MARRAVVAPEEGNWFAVQQVYQAVHSGETGISVLPGAIEDLLERKAWRKFRRPNGETKTYKAGELAEFITTKPTEGLGATPELLERLLDGNTHALRLLTEGLRRPSGRPKNGETFDNIQGLEAPTGTARAAALRRLRKSRPDLLAQVEAEELSPHAAMVEAGFRPRTVTVRLDSPERVAAALARHLSPEELLKVASLIGGTP